MLRALVNLPCIQQCRDVSLMVATGGEGDVMKM